MEPMGLWVGVRVQDLGFEVTDVDVEVEGGGPG